MGRPENAGAPQFCRYAAYPASRLIAHRGGGDRAPENTLAGLRAAAEAGFAAVEFDVMLSADGVPVLIHDETLTRTSNGQGLVCETSAAQLARLDAGSWFAPAFAGEPLPTLAQALDLCRQLGLWANVEIKPAAGHEQQTGKAVAELVAARGCDPATILLSSFSVGALGAARLAQPHLPRALLLESCLQDWQDCLRQVAAVALHCAASGVNGPLVEAAHQAGYALACYTVNTEKELMRVASLGVDAVFTDRLAWGRYLPGALPINP